MTELISRPDVYTDFQGLTEMRTRARKDSEETLREVAGQFEALFIQMMLKTMRDASLGDGLLDSEHTRTYQGMYDKQIAIDMSKSPGIGLADMMVRQLSKPGSSELSATRPAAGDDSVEAADRLEKRSSINNQPESAATRQRWTPASPEEFIKDVWPHAKRAAGALGVQPEALVAQAALETGWGKHMIKTHDGASSFNMFGIKADSRWQGDRAASETLEFRDGLVRKERAQFRVYGSLKDSFNDYAEFLQRNPRYQDALTNAADTPTFTRSLKDAGYATDPAYSEKINNIMNSERVRATVAEIKASAPEPLNQV